MLSRSCHRTGPASYEGRGGRRSVAMDSLKAWKDVLQTPSLIDCSAAFAVDEVLNVVGEVGIV